MNLGELKSTMDLLKAMQELELAVSEFYRLCGESWVIDKEFWGKISAQEQVHARNLSRMAELLAANPSNYVVGRPLAAVAARTFIDGVRKNALKLKDRQLDRKATLGVARDFENSILESRYSEILRTDEIEFQRLLSEIVEQTKEHRMLLNEKLAAVQ